MSVTNTLTALNPEYWSKRLQVLLTKSLVSRQIANFEERSNLRNWDVVHRVIPWDVVVNNYTPWTDTTEQAMAMTDESLTVNISKEITMYADENELTQASLNYMNMHYIDRAGYKLRDEMDGRFLREIINADNDFDDGDVGWTDWNAISLTSSNVSDVFSDAWAKLRANNVETDRPWYAVVTPEVIAKMKQSMILSGFNEADMTLKNWWFDSGMRGKFLGWNVLESNNVCHSTVVTHTGQPSADDSIDIAWVTFKFVAAPSAAWDVDIGSDADGSYDNLAAAINLTWTAWTDYVAVSTANRNILKNANVYAVSDTTANTLTIYTSGKYTVIENVADPLDNATISATRALCYLARDWATDMVLQKDVTVQRNKAQLRNGYFYLLWDLYGLKTFDEGDARMLELNVAV